MLRAVNATDLFSRAQNMATSAWKKNTALSEEANKRYATTESKLKNLKNTALLFGQQIGDDLNPTIRSLIDGAEELLQKFLSMDEGLVEGRMQIQKATSGNSSDSTCGNCGDLFFGADDGMLAGRSSGNTFAAYDYMGGYPCIPAGELDAGTRFHGSSICRYGTSCQRIIRRCEAPVDPGKRTGSIQKNGAYASGQLETIIMKKAGLVCPAFLAS